MNSFNSSDLIFVPLGGSGEIGMNANLYHFESSWLMVDLGISFADVSMPGADVVLPDISFIERHRDSLQGLVLTHAHEDHFGAIPYLWKRLGCPIYGSPFTLALLQSKLAEYNPGTDIPMHELTPGRAVQMGPFSIETVEMAHSIPDSVALCIRCAAGTVLHTGDWKFDENPGIGRNTDSTRLKQIGDEGVLAMVGDSTNAMEEGRSGSEAHVEKALRDVVAKARGRIALTCFASNVARVQSAIKAAQHSGKAVAIVGKALKRAISAAQKVGYLRDMPEFVDEHDIGLVPREDLMIICTGTQGEPGAAMAKISQATHDTVKLQAGDTVIYSSSQIPGNEHAISRVQDRLIRRGITLVTDDDADVHVSGHPCRDELTEMYALVRPRMAVPVHGTARHLVAHAKLAKSCQVGQTIIPDNGSMIRLANADANSRAKAEVIDTVWTGALTQDRGRVVGMDGEMMRQRRKLLRNGIVTASILIDGKGRLCGTPALKQTGIGERESADEYIAAATIAVEDAVRALNPADARSDSRIESVVMREINRTARTMLSLRPIVHVHVVRGGDARIESEEVALAS